MTIHIEHRLDLFLEEEDAKELVRIQQKYKGVNLGFYCDII